MPRNTAVSGSVVPSKSQVTGPCGPSILAKPGRGLPMQATQIEEKFLLLVPERTERDVDRRAGGWLVAPNILQAAAADICLQAHVGDQIEAVTGPRGHDFGQLHRAARRTAVPAA
jgi:hypothetical protein